MTQVLEKERTTEVESTDSKSRNPNDLGLHLGKYLMDKKGYFYVPDQYVRLDRDYSGRFRPVDQYRGRMVSYNRRELENRAELSRR